MSDPDTAHDIQHLRRLAEEQQRDDPRRPVPDTPEGLRHELSVHQVELELQNETLRESVRQLEEARDRYQDLYDFAPVGYVTLSENGTVLEANLRAARLLGLERARLLERRFALFVAAESRTHLAVVLPRALAGNETVVAELQLQRSDGSTFPVRVELEARGPGACRMAFADITAEKEAQAQLLQLNETLEQRVTERTLRIRELGDEFENFTLGVAEDLMVPLRRITSVVNTLRNSETPLVAAPGEHFAQVFRSVDWLEELVRALTEYTRVSRMRLRVAPLDLNRVLAEVSKDLQPALAEHGVSLTSEALPTVPGDSTAMQLVFAKLLENAVKFTAGREGARVRVDAEETDSEFIVRVQDNGVGFNNRHRDKLFMVFKRLHPESAFQGAGMGLPIARRLCVRLGGRLWGEGKVNEGATFYVALPKQPQLLE